MRKNCVPAFFISTFRCILTVVFIILRADGIDGKKHVDVCEKKL